MTRILHLSDPHFGGHHHFRQGDAWRGSAPTLGQAVADALSASLPEPRVDYLVVSGDLFSSDQSSDRADAQDRLRELADLLELEPGRILIVPGNHDLTWEPERRHSSFRFYDEVVEAVGASGRTGELPVVVASDSEGLAFLLLDSCRIESEKLAGLGEIGNDQMRTARERLKAAGVTPATHTIIAVLHHHLLPIGARQSGIYDPNGPERGVLRMPSLTVDAVAVLQQLSEIGVSVILHGHQHQPAALVHENLLYDLRPIPVLAAGSCGANLHEGRRHFFTIDIDGDRADVMSFQAEERNPDAFALAADKTVELPLLGQSPVVGLDGYCPEDASVRRQVVVDPDLPSDSSDLVVVMLSVTSCPAARREIRAAVRDLPPSLLLPGTDRPTVRLMGMYDLLGNWDLAVRLRIDPPLDPQVVVAHIVQRLRDRRLHIDGGRFGRNNVLNVRVESGSLTTGLARGELQPIKRRILGTTEAYERLRCQRSFLWIELSSLRQSDLVSELARAIEDHPATAAIIESVSWGDRVLLLETFAACGQSSEIARLNRLVEPVLAVSVLQKYTLTCYGYDEETTPELDQPEPLVSG